MLKINKKYWLTIAIAAASIVLIILKITKRPTYTGGNKVINHPNVIELKNINTIKEKVKNNDKFILYIGHSLCSDCGDFYNNPFQTILNNNDDIKFYYIDYISRKKYTGNWEKLIGPKNEFGDPNAISSPMINNFTFYFTPTLVFIENKEAKYVFSDYGGGDKYESRYFRTTPDKHELGWKNAIEDVQELINKWK